MLISKPGKRLHSFLGKHLNHKNKPQQLYSSLLRTLHLRYYNKYIKTFFCVQLLYHKKQQWPFVCTTNRESECGCVCLSEGASLWIRGGEAGGGCNSFPLMVSKHLHRIKQLSSECIRVASCISQKRRATHQNAQQNRCFIPYISLSIQNKQRTIGLWMLPRST